MLDLTPRYRIAEVFYSLQGEGAHVGTAMVFVRFAGCNLKCAFCDTDHSEKHHATLMELMNEIEHYPPGVPICLTGGEPFLQINQPLLTGLSADLGRQIHVETNGTIEISGALVAGIDWITCSPKKGAAVKLNPKWIDEFKILYPFEVDIDAVCMSNPTAKWYVQPIAVPDERENRRHLKGAILYCKQNPAWRLSLQMHKMLRIK